MLAPRSVQARAYRLHEGCIGQGGRTALKGWLGVVFERELDAARDLLVGELRCEPQTEVNACGHPAPGEAVAIDDDAPLHRVCPALRQELVKSPVRIE